MLALRVFKVIRKCPGTGPGLSELRVFGKDEAGYRQVRIGKDEAGCRQVRIYRVLRETSEDWQMTFGLGVMPHKRRGQAPKALKCIQVVLEIQTHKSWAASVSNSYLPHEVDLQHF